MEQQTVSAEQYARWLENEREQRAKERAEKSFYEFVKQAWPEVDPAHPFLPNWHVGAVAEALESVSNGQIKKVVINIPPGSGKSLIVCVFFPVWEWIHAPAIQFITGSYSERFAIRDSQKAKRLIESAWFQRRWGNRFKLGETGFQSAQGNYENDRSGFRIAFGILGGTGRRADRIIIDDAHQIDEAKSDAKREAAVTNYREVLTMRANDVKKAAWIIVGQRLHERDLPGQMIDMGYEAVRIPMRYDPAYPWKPLRDHFTYSDPRHNYGEILFPQHWDEEEVQSQERNLGPYAASGQLQQRPSPADGGIFKRKWFMKFWCGPKDNFKPYVVRSAESEIVCEQTILDLDDPNALEEVALSYDATFKKSNTSDFVVGQAWGRKKADRFLLDQERARMDFNETLNSIRAMSKRWPRAMVKYIERAANGEAIINVLQHELPGVIGVPPIGPKESRAQAVAPQFAAGNVWLPHPERAPWVEKYIEEFMVFPNGAHDDCIDSTSMLLNQWLGGWLGFIEYLKISKQEDDNKQQVAQQQSYKKEAVATNDSTVKCPKCGSAGVTRLCGNQGYRCVEGHQWGHEVRVEIPKRGQEMRKNYIPNYRV